MAEGRTSEDSFNTNYGSESSPSYQQEEPQSYYDDPSTLVRQQNNQPPPVPQANYPPHARASPQADTAVPQKPFSLPPGRTNPHRGNQRIPEDLLLSGMDPDQVSKLKE